MGRLLDLFRERARTVGGRVSALVLDADGREVLALAPDEVMTAASVIKLPLVMTLFLDAAEGRLDLAERVAVAPRVGGSGVLSHLPGVADMTLGDLAAISLTVSDNTAANRLIERVGIDRVDQRLDEWGCPRTRLRRALFDLAAQARGLENVMSARETASLLWRVVVGARDGDPALRRILRLLEWNSDLSRLGRYLPLRASLAHKDGWLYDPVPVENDAGIVRARATGATNARGSDAELDSLLAVPAAVVVGFTEGVDARVARPLLGMLGLAAAEVAGVDLGTLPSEVVGSA